MPQRITLPLTDDGTAVDWTSMRRSSAERLEQLIKTDPVIAKAYEETHGLNTEDGASEQLFDGVSLENVAKGLDLVSSVNALLFQIVAAKWIKHPLLKTADGKPVPLVLEKDILDSAFTLTPKQHEELDPRAHRIALKYSNNLPDWLKEHMDIYLFTSMYLSYTAKNVQNAMKAQVFRDIAKYQTAAASKSAPRPIDSDVPKTNGHDATPMPPDTLPLAAEDGEIPSA